MESFSDPLDAPSRAQTASKKEIEEASAESQDATMALQKQDMQMHLNVTANHSKSTVVIVPKSVIKSKLSNATKKAAPAAKLTAFQ